MRELLTEIYIQKRLGYNRVIPARLVEQQMINLTMRIVTENKNFKPEHFEIFDFYGETTCFAWNTKNLALFPFESTERFATPTLLLSPAPLKSVHCFSGRIFIICHPSGIYKLSKSLQFAVLSKTGIGIGAEYFEVLILSDKYFSLYDKKNNINRPLFKKIPAHPTTPSFLQLKKHDTDHDLWTALTQHQDLSTVCISTHGNAIYKIFSNTIHIIYSYFYPISQILPLKINQQSTACLMFLTSNSTVLLMHAKNCELLVERVYLYKEIRAICAGISEDSVWILHSDGSRLNSVRKTLGAGSGQLVRNEREERDIVCLRSFGSGAIGMTSKAELLELSLELSERCKEDEFVSLKPEMLRGTDAVVDAICERVKVLQDLSAELQAEQSKLRRINMFARRQKLRTDVRSEVRCVADETFLRNDFGSVLPEKSLVRMSVRSNGRKMFKLKEVEEGGTVLEMRVPEGRLRDSVEVGADLVTLAGEGDLWCLIKDFVEDGDAEKGGRNLRKERMQFVRAKLDALRNLRSDGNIDVRKLNAIKDSVRRELGRS